MNKYSDYYLKIHGGRIEKLMYENESYAMKGSYGGAVNLREINLHFRGLIERLEKLNKELTEKDMEINNLQQKNEMYQKQIEGIVSDDKDSV